MRSAGTTQASELFQVFEALRGEEIPLNHLFHFILYNAKNMTEKSLCGRISFYKIVVNITQDMKQTHT